jgi:phenylalanyl-tRNA synthetase alpha chain
MSDIESLTRSALAEIESAASLEALDALRVSLLGKSGSITGQLKQLGALAP